MDVLLCGGLVERVWGYDGTTNSRVLIRMKKYFPPPVPQDELQPL
jgi:hypothetical protein